MVHLSMAPQANRAANDDPKSPTLFSLGLIESIEFIEFRAHGVSWSLGSGPGSRQYCQPFGFELVACWGVVWRVRNHVGLINKGLI